MVEKKCGKELRKGTKRERWCEMCDRISFGDLAVKTLTKVEGNVGSDEMIFVTDVGGKFRLYHERDCCEDVLIEDICGDLCDLVGSPILLAEEVVSDEDPAGYVGEYSHDASFTWTFYKLSTIKGSVTIRWLGESNGYYSESVEFKQVGGISGSC